MAEINGNGQPLRESGYYKHKETGAIVELDANPDNTSTLDAFAQVGFVKIDDSEVPKKVVPAESGAVEVVGEDKFTETETKTGKVQYRKNGKLISKDEYENK